MNCPAEHQTLKRGLILVLSSNVPPIIERISGYRSRVMGRTAPTQSWGSTTVLLVVERHAGAVAE